MENIYQKMDAHILGKLTGEESHNLEKLLAEDGSLRAEYDMRKRLVDGLEVLHKNDLKKKISGFAAQNAAIQPSEQPRSQAKTVKMFPLRRVLALAASLALLVALFIWLRNGPSLTPGEIADRHLTWPDANTLIGGTNRDEPGMPIQDDKGKIVAELQTAYAKKDYQEALRLAQSFPEKNNPDWAFTLGILFFQNGRYSEARTQLQLASQGKNAADCEWYLAMILLRQGANQQELTAAFSKIAAQKGKWAGQAEQVLRDLGK